MVNDTGLIRLVPRRIGDIRARRAAVIPDVRRPDSAAAYGHSTGMHMRYFAHGYANI